MDILDYHFGAYKSVKKQKTSVGIDYVVFIVHSARITFDPPSNSDV